MQMKQCFKRMTRKLGFGRDDAAAFSLASPLGIVSVIIGAVVGLIVLAALFPTYLGGVADLVGAMTDENTTTGDDTADGLLPIFGLVTAFAGLFAILGLVFVVVKLRGGRGG
jgi:hypothetical protein